MKLKKDRGRFTVRFDMENPDHVRAVEYLERHRARGKAQYLTDAILCYEKAEMKSFQQTDRALIEQIVQEYLEKQLHAPCVVADRRQCRRSRLHFAAHVPGPRQ